MATITADIKIPEVHASVSVHLYYPTDLPAEVGCEVRGVITLLHGMGNSPADWMQLSAAPRYAADNGYVLVAPAAGNSFYSDMRHGAPWYTILTQLLPQQLHRIFKLPAEREKNFIAGLSMGGYGAIRLGLSHPSRYAAAGSFSGPLDMRTVYESCVRGHSRYLPLLTPVFGASGVLPDEADLFCLAKQAAALPAAQRPRLYCSCGARDEDDMHIHSQNQQFLNVVRPLGLSVAYREWDGVHEWNFWDRSLADFIGFIQNSDYGLRKQRDWN